MSIQIAAGIPVGISVAFQSPQVVAYRLWYHNPGDLLSTKLGTGTDKGPVVGSVYPFAAPVMGNGSMVIYLIRLYGNPNQPYRVVLTLTQNGVVLPEGSIVLTGNTGGSGYVELNSNLMFRL